MAFSSAVHLLYLKYREIRISNAFHMFSSELEEWPKKRDTIGVNEDLSDVTEVNRFRCFESSLYRCNLNDL